MKIGICNDHAAYDYKLKLAAHLRRRGYEVVDYGCDSPESCDYPDFAHALARGVENGEVELGVAMCGTGNGMAMTLNKHSSIRAGLAWTPEIGTLVREHNNANVLVMPARYISFSTSEEVLDAWLDAEFAGGRHLRRVVKIPKSTSD